MAKIPIIHYIHVLGDRVIGVIGSRWSDRSHLAYLDHISRPFTEPGSDTIYRIKKPFIIQT